MGTLLPSANVAHGFCRSTVLLMVLSNLSLIVCPSCRSVAASIPMPWSSVGAGWGKVNTPHCLIRNLTIEESLPHERILPVPLRWEHGRKTRQ